MKKKGVEFWPETLEHITQTWQKKKGRKYPFLGQDFKTLKTMLRIFSPQEVLGMWEIYLRGTTYWGPKTGFLISGMLQDRSHLIDHPDLKKLVVKYAAELGMKEPEQITLELGLTKGALMKTMLVILMLSSTALACPAGTTEYQGSCAADLKPEQGVNIKVSNEKPPKSGMPSYQNETVKADMPQSLIYSDDRADEKKMESTFEGKPAEGYVK